MTNNSNKIISTYLTVSIKPRHKIHNKWLILIQEKYLRKIVFTRSNFNLPLQVRFVLVPIFTTKWREFESRDKKSPEAIVSTTNHVHRWRLESLERAISQPHDDGPKQQGNC